MSRQCRDNSEPFDQIRWFTGNITGNAIEHYKIDMQEKFIVDIILGGGIKVHKIV